MSEKMKIFFKFLVVSILTAFFFEIIANTIAEGKTFKDPAWPVFLVLWYGFLYTILFLMFSKRPLWQGVIFFAILGNIVEIFVFHRSHLLVDSIIYALMGLVPLWLCGPFISKQT